MKTGYTHILHSDLIATPSVYRQWVIMTSFVFSPVLSSECLNVPACSATEPYVLMHQCKLYLPCVNTSQHMLTHSHLQPLTSSNYIVIFLFTFKESKTSSIFCECMLHFILNLILTCFIENLPL